VLKVLPSRWETSGSSVSAVHPRPLEKRFRTTLTYKLNTNITSRRLPEAPDLSEALLIIDDAFPAHPVPSDIGLEPPPPPQILCAPLGSLCPATGTGGTPNPYQTQPNVFVGKQTGVDSIEWKIPIDPPGANQTRIIRMTNIRANAALVGASTTLIPNSLQATVAIQGAQPPLLAVPQGGVLVANVVPGALASVTSSASIPRCEPHNASLLGGKGAAAFDFSVQVQEGYSYAFRYRNYGTELFGAVFPPVLVEQNIPGFDYATETGFYSPGLFTTAPTLGLADFGTRIHVSVGPISAGTHLFVPTAITLSGAYGEGTPAGQLQLVQANENGNSAPGYEPVASTAMVGTTPVAQASISGSTAYATYEVIYADPSVLETATIPVAVAFTNQPAVGEVMATTSLGPLGTSETANETSPIPRFTNLATAQEAYSITSCPAQ
jgi:hypothetical protein